MTTVGYFIAITDMHRNKLPNLTFQGLRWKQQARKHFQYFGFMVLWIFYLMFSKLLKFLATLFGGIQYKSFSSLFQ